MVADLVVLSTTRHDHAVTRNESPVFAVVADKDQKEEQNPTHSLSLVADTVAVAPAAP